MISFWKLKREVLRILVQVKNVPGFLVEYFFSTPYYDLILSKQERQFDGELPFTGKVAIYLIFPDSGLLASHIMALEAIRHNGYSALVVSNLPLSVEVRDQLQKLCWRFIERPNYGYDFGGYRSGVLSLGAVFPSIDRLVLLNDSTWFPLPGRQNWFEQAEKLDVDFAAAASNYGAKRIDMDEYQKQD